MRRIRIVHEVAGQATVPESTARVLFHRGWVPVDRSIAEAWREAAEAKAAADAPPDVDEDLEAPQDDGPSAAEVADAFAEARDITIDGGPSDPSAAELDDAFAERQDIAIGDAPGDAAPGDEPPAKPPTRKRSTSKSRSAKP
jgi:hypothetical protein